MSRLLAEAFGTAVLVLLGCGAVAIGGYGVGFPLGILPVAFAFGLAVTAMIYTIGPISGCHINPAVTLGVLSAGRISVGQAAGYIVAQLIGGALGAALLYGIVSGKLSGYNLAESGLGHNGWGPDYLGGYGTAAAFLVEVIATFIFVLAILRITTGEQFGAVAGLVIGLTLLLLHLPFVNVTGLSVNPARSFGPALVVGGNALGQLWLFLIAPSIGGVLAGIANRAIQPD
ncbi:aquaporin [Microvirga brassicacearum]|uniref:Aquaporin n=1 Tax=Microvirga brassicacearum TaxID=2580413 RepID=A0A5N3P6K1_9HYPH|nr:aquaporin [Microvirga brassicacearum]KAB0265377.1 aquaporin [Microvirga brassicacearum]